MSIALSSRPGIRAYGPLLLLILLAGTGCATLRQIAALRRVDFSLDGVSDVRLAGIDLSRVRSYEQLGFADVTRLTVALAAGDLPLDLQLDVGALNPADNPTEARLVRMSWTLLLRDRETLSGVFDDEVLLPPGQPRSLAFPVRVNLVEFFDGGAQELVQLALSAAGQSDEPLGVALRATPVIETPLGPIQYPSPITIVER